MAYVVAVAGAKGGTGKTTVAFNLAAILARTGQRTVLVDLDPSCDAASSAAIAVEDPPMSNGGDEVSDEIDGGSRTRAGGPARVRHGEPRPSPRARGLSVVPLEGDLDAEVETDSEETRTLTLKMREEFDLTIIDCPVRWSASSRVALAAADLVLIPVELPLDALAARATRRVARRLASLVAPKSGEGGSAKSEAPLLRAVGWNTSHTNANPAHHRRGELAESGNGDGEHDSASAPLPMLNAIVPRDPAVAEALDCGRPLIDHDPGARATRGFVELAREILALLDARGRRGSGGSS